MSSPLAPNAMVPVPHLVGYRGVLHASGEVDGELRAVEDMDGRRPLR